MPLTASAALVILTMFWVFCPVCLTLSRALLPFVCITSTAKRVPGGKKKGSDHVKFMLYPPSNSAISLTITAWSPLELSIYILSVLLSSMLTEDGVVIVDLATFCTLGVLLESKKKRS